MKIVRISLALMLLSGASFASSHREAPAIANDPAADNTDVYAFVSADKTKLNIIANWIPFEEPSSGPNFFKWSDDVQYQIHITQGNGNPIRDNIVYTFRFSTQTVPKVAVPSAKAPCSAPGTAACVGGGKEFFSQITGDAKTTGGHIVQTYTVTKTVNGVDTVLANATAGSPFISAPWRIGPRTQKTLNALAPGLVTSATYDDAYAATFIATTADGARLFAGPRDDGFYVDLGGIFDLANLRPKAGTGGAPASCTPGTPCAAAQDGLAGYNVHSIALEIPTTQLTSDGKAPGAAASDANTIGIWATSNRKKVSIIRSDGRTTGYGPWVQVSRLGIPLINEAVIGYQDKDKYNRSKPKDDVANFGAYFLNPVIVPDAEAVGIYAALGVPVDDSYRYGRTDIIDVINLATAGCTTYPATPCHTVSLANTGDVLRIDLNLPSGFPNGRSIPGATGPNAARQEQADVTDVLLTLLLAKPAALSKTGGNGGPPFIQDGVDYNDKPFLTKFPWLALPWDGYSEGHGKVTP